MDFRILSLLVFLVPCRTLPLLEWRFFQRHPLPGIAWKQISFVLCSPSLVFLAGLGVMYCLYRRHGAEGGLFVGFFFYAQFAKFVSVLRLLLSMSMDSVPGRGYSRKFVA